MAATTTFALAAGGTGTALASTTAGLAHGQTASTEQACAQAQAAVYKVDKEILGVETPDVFLGAAVRVALNRGIENVALETIERAEPVGQVILGLYEGSMLTVSNVKALYACDPGLFKGKPQVGTNIPHPPPPAWLKQILLKSHNRLQG